MKQKNSSDWLIGCLLFHWVEVINYLINCLFTTPIHTTGKNSGFRIIARIHSTERRNISVFQAGKRKLLARGQGSVVYSTMELYSHAEIFFLQLQLYCRSFYRQGMWRRDIYWRMREHKGSANSPRIYSIQKSWDRVYHDHNSQKAIWMIETMEHTLVNPNQMNTYGATVQDNPFAKAPIFIAAEDHDFTLLLSSKGTIFRTTKIIRKDKELQTWPHVTYSSAHEWDPHNIWFPKSSYTVEKDISMHIGTVMTEGGSPELTNTDSGSDSVDQIYDIGAMTIRMIGSVKVASITSMNVSETKTTV